MVGCIDALPDKVFKEIKVSESADDEENENQTSGVEDNNDSE